MIRIRQDMFSRLQGDMTDKKFAETLGINRSQLFRVKNGYSSVGAGLLEGFMLAFPELNVHDYFRCSGRLGGRNTDG